MRRYELAAERGLDQLQLVERADPTPAAGEILVRVRASSLNFHDYIVAMGWFPADEGRIPMSDGAGEVVAVGEGITEFAVGDRVISTYFANWLNGPVRADAVAKMRGDQVDGFAAELVARPFTDFTRAPEGLSFEQAATLPCAGLTAWRALIVEADLKPGSVVLVQGSGGVSIFALQFALMAGATVIATTSSEEKGQKLRNTLSPEVYRRLMCLAHDCGAWRTLANSLALRAPSPPSRDSWLKVSRFRGMLIPAPGLAGGQPPPVVGSSPRL